MRRAEADPEYIPHDPITIGTAEPGPTHSDRPAGVIWVPDPEQRHGWREVYVDKLSTKPDRSVGFRKP